MFIFGKCKKALTKNHTIIFISTGKVVSFPRQYVIKPEEGKFRVFSLKGNSPI